MGRDKLGKKRPLGDGVISGLDSNGNVTNVGSSGVGGDRIKVITEDENILSRILTELKIISSHLEILTEVELDEHNIEK